MEYSEIDFFANMLNKQEAKKHKDRLHLGAWIGWQMGAGGTKSFGEYYKNFGIDDTAPLDKKTAALIAAKAKEKAERIVAMAQKGKTNEC